MIRTSTSTSAGTSGASARIVDARGLAASLRTPLASERGSSQIFMILTVVALIVVVGLVVDGAGKVQAATSAQHVAASAARAATSAIAADVVESGTVSVDPALAEIAALDHIARSGMTGTVSVMGDAITVTTSTSHSTVFLSLIGITSLPASGEATALLIDGP